MNVSPAGRQLIERNEGCVLHSYYDVVGVLTIGYGNTGRGVYVGQVITKTEADQLLSDRLANEFEPGVLKAAGAVITQNQFDAMVSLEYNIGTGAFAGSTVARKHRAGDYVGAADAFLSWNKAGGSVLPALDRRRHEERAMYLSGVVSAPIVPATNAPSGSAHIRVLRLLSPPMTGDDVKELQTALGITADSIFGHDTEVAIMTFQTDHGLIGDGIVGPKTWDQLAN